MRVLTLLLIITFIGPAVILIYIMISRRFYRNVLPIFIYSCLYQFGTLTPWTGPGSSYPAATAGAIRATRGIGTVRTAGAVRGINTKI